MDIVIKDLDVYLTFIEIEKYVEERDDAGDDICFANFLLD